MYDNERLGRPEKRLLKSVLIVLMLKILRPKKSTAYQKSIPTFQDKVVLWLCFCHGYQQLLLRILLGLPDLKYATQYACASKHYRFKYYPLA